MTFGSGGGAPKTIQVLTDAPGNIRVLSNREFYQCPLDTLAIVTPILFAYGTGSINDPDSFSFDGIKIKSTDPITGGIIRHQTCYGPMSGLPYDNPHFGRVFLHPNLADAMNGTGLGPYAQRYEKYFGVPIVTNAGGGSAPTVTAKEGYGGSIIVYPGEVLSYGAVSGYGPSVGQWRLRYGLLEYGVAT